MTYSESRTSDVAGAQLVADGAVLTYTQDPEHVMPRHFISEPAYAEAVAGLVIVCTDAVIVDRVNETFYLARRRHLPMAGLWWIGGRMNAGELETASIVRAFKRETQLDLAPNRFTLVPGGLTRYFWSEREQDPQSVGSDNLCYTFAVELTADELSQAAVKLDPEEYDARAGLRPYGHNDLQFLLAQGQLHPVIWEIYQRVFGESI